MNENINDKSEEKIVSFDEFDKIKTKKRKMNNFSNADNKIVNMKSAEENNKDKIDKYMTKYKELVEFVNDFIQEEHSFTKEFLLEVPYGAKNFAFSYEKEEGIFNFSVYYNNKFIKIDLNLNTKSYSIEMLHNVSLSYTKKENSKKYDISVKPSPDISIIENICTYAHIGEYDEVTTITSSNGDIIRSKYDYGKDKKLITEYHAFIDEEVKGFTNISSLHNGKRLIEEVAYAGNNEKINLRGIIDESGTTRFYEGKIGNLAIKKGSYVVLENSGIDNCFESEINICNGEKAPIKVGQDPNYKSNVLVVERKNHLDIAKRTIEIEIEKLNLLTKDRNDILNNFETFKRYVNPFGEYVLEITDKDGIVSEYFLRNASSIYLMSNYITCMPHKYSRCNVMIKDFFRNFDTSLLLAKVYRETNLMQNISRKQEIVTTSLDISSNDLDLSICRTEFYNVFSSCSSKSIFKKYQGGDVIAKIDTLFKGILLEWEDEIKKDKESIKTYFKELNSYNETGTEIVTQEKRTKNNVTDTMVLVSGYIDVENEDMPFYEVYDSTIMKFNNGMLDTFYKLEGDNEVNPQYEVVDEQEQIRLIRMKLVEQNASTEENNKYNDKNTSNNEKFRFIPDPDADPITISPNDENFDDVIKNLENELGEEYGFEKN